MDESGTDVSECCKKMESGRKVEGAISFLVNSMSL